VTNLRVLDQPEPEPRPEASASYLDWDAVYQDNVIGVYQLLFRRVGNATDAEDLASEVLLRTLKTLRFPAAVHSVRAYLVKTAHSVLAEHWREHYAAKEAAQELERIPAEALAQPPNAETTDRAGRVLALLPENFRSVLELRFLRGFSVREAARELGLSESNVRVLQFRALKKAAELQREVLA
jgi:RNA polymerase sigma-70 factor, ECF subfamily